MKTKEQLEILTNNADNEIFSKYKIDKKIFDEWISKHGDLPRIHQIESRMASNFDRLLKIEQPEFKFEYPKELTKEQYIKYIKLAYAKFRYDIYHHVQKVLEESGQNNLTDDEFNDALKKCSLPEIKNKVYRKMNFPEIEGDEPVRTVMKAYLSMMHDEAWHKEILHIQREHKQILFKIPEGKKIQNLYEDPLESIDKQINFEDGKIIDEALKEEGVDAAEVKVQEVCGQDSKKKVSGFSFMGNKNDQEQLIKDFLNRNKKNDEDAKKEDAKKEDTKKEDTKKEDAKKEDAKIKDAKKEDAKNKNAKEDAKKEDVKKEDAKKGDVKKQDDDKNEVQDDEKNEVQDDKQNKEPEKENIKKDESQKSNNQTTSDNKNNHSVDSSVRVINKSETDVLKPSEKIKDAPKPKLDLKDSKDKAASNSDVEQVPKLGEKDKDVPKPNITDIDNKVKKPDDEVSK